MDLAARLHGPYRPRYTRPNPLPESVHLGAAIAPTLEELHPTDRPCTLAGAPWGGEGGSTRLMILAKATSPGTKRQEG